MYKPKINLLCSKVIKYFAEEDRITIDKYLQHATTDLSTISQFFSGFYTTKIIKIGSFLTKLLKIKVSSVF